MRRLVSARLRTVRRDEGVAMVVVIGVTMVLTLLVVAGLTYSVGTMRKARNDQQWSAALAAAYAGVEEYLSRLANDPAYLSFGNPASPFSSETGSTVVLPETRGGHPNPAFSLADWAVVPGSDGDASFRYEVDNSSYYSDGTVRLRSTGRVGQEVRTIVADLRQRGFIDYLYFTNFETQDPDVTPRTTDSHAKCQVYEHATPSRSSDCTLIQFGNADEIDGPLHSNDTLQLCGSPQFLGQTTSTYQPPSGQLRYKRPSGCAASPVFAVNGIQPGWAGYMSMPPTNTELKRETRSDLPTEVPNPGCLFTGPTTVVFQSNGKMRVRSPWTKATSPNGANNSGCGTPGPSGLGSSTGQLLDVPNGTVIYVQNVPNVSSDPNYWGTWEAGRPSCPANGNPVGYPAPNEVVRYTDAYGCRNGDLFVEGTLKGQVTAAAENYVYVTDDLRYADRDDDILGLVGNNAVWVWNPYRNVSGTSACSNSPNHPNYNSCQWTGTPLKGKDRRIDAAILSVAHTFMVQNYDVRNASGQRHQGTLTVYGAIAQQYRGTVAMTSGGSFVSGYAKDYRYDLRFVDTGPPKFISPAVVTYGARSWIEVSPAFDADGNPA